MSQILKPRVRRAVEIREASLKVMNLYGRWENNFRRGDRFVPGRVASIGHTELSLRTPFTPLPGPPQKFRYLAALYGLPTPKTLPYGLDIWAPKKVMNIEWNDGGEIVIVSFHRGAWEDEVIAAADASGVQFA